MREVAQLIQFFIGLFVGIATAGFVMRSDCRAELAELALGCAAAVGQGKFFQEEDLE